MLSLQPLRGALGRQATGLRAAVSTMHRFRDELAPHRRRLGLATLASLGYTLCELAAPWPLKLILDNVVKGKPLVTPWPGLDRLLGQGQSLLALAVLSLLVLAGLRGMLYYARNVLTSRVGQDLVMQVRRRLFAHMQRLSLSFHHHQRTGDLLIRLTGDIILLRDLVVSSLLSLVSEALVLLGYAAVMLVLSWKLALATLGVIPAMFVLVSLYTSQIRQATRSQRKREGALAARTYQVLAGIQVVKLFAREDDEDEQLRQLTQRSLKSGLKTTRLEARMNRDIELSIAVASALALWIGAGQVMQGLLTSGELVVFVFYMRGFYRPLRRISQVAERASKAATCVERIVEILDLDSDVPDGVERPPRLKGGLEIDLDGHAYRSGVPVLGRMRLEVAPGRKLALVGESGAGKSTLLSFIPRLQDPSDGRVRIDGHDVRRFRLAELRQQISVVPQDALLFGGTIRENIAYGKPDASEAEIEAAARAAQAHGFIQALSEGYDSRVGERGVTLSGGQRQRIAIARAIIKDAPIVLLDEPASGLDAVSEARVLAALDRLMRGRTAVIIAHRLETVRRADEIVVLKAGQVVDRGRHEALLERCDYYRELCRRAATREAVRRQTADIGGRA